MTKKVQILMDKNNHKVQQLKKWLKQNKVKYEEWSIHDDKVKEILLNSAEFQKTYCDAEACAMNLPAIHLEETDKYFFVDMIDFDAFYKLKDILEID